jgi:hypothetical protein
MSPVVVVVVVVVVEMLSRQHWLDCMLPVVFLRLQMVDRIHLCIIQGRNTSDVDVTMH